MTFLILNKIEVNQENINNYKNQSLKTLISTLQTFQNIPNPDLLIRTGNTNRLSNFLFIF